VRSEQILARSKSRENIIDGRFFILCGAMQELILLAASNVQHNRGNTDKRLRGYATIQFVEAIRGGIFLSYDEQIYELESGYWFFPAHPGPHLRFHALRAGGDWHHRHIAFAGPLVEKWRAAGIWLEKPQDVEAGAHFAARMDQLVAWARDGDQLMQRRAINGLEGLLLELAANRAQKAEQNEWLSAILVALEGQNSPNFSQIARDMGLSDTALRRRFKAAAGQTMQEWVLSRKMSAARALLSDSELPLRAIASRLGYQNEFFFSRQFKMRVGVAPGAFRRSRQK
jgi:AraC-like DNA-binding protein